MFTKVLVANRGEIAIRVFRTLREMGIASVAVYSEADRDSPFVVRADEAYLIGPGPSAESYLRGDVIIDVARRSGAQAVHPGFGFLAENAGFARSCAEAGLVFVGPPPEAIEAMGQKTSAREVMAAAGVPIVPGGTEAAATAEEARRIAEEIGYPVAIKAAAGGGGKGIRTVRAAGELEAAYASARREGAAYFGDDAVYLERYLDDPRHIEVQVLADAHGNVIHLGERDCTIQRRHQKIVEETPSPAVSPELRERIGAIAVDAARAVGYVGAGTVEGLLAADGSWYFLEMNTRLQVEHTITEMVTGLDLVREQIWVAGGRPLGWAQADVRLYGHSIQCRINAEDPIAGFVPTPGRVTHYREPSGPGVRVDSGVVEGTVISDLYDPMVAKLIVWDEDRDLARRRMLRALGEFEVGGVATLIPLHRAIMAAPRSSRPAARCATSWRAAASRARRRLGRCRGPAGDRDACRRGRGRREAVRGRDRGARASRPGAAAGAAGGHRRPRGHRPRRGRRRSQPHAGHRAARRGRRRRPGRGRPGAGRGRGDEDGERDRRPARGRDRVGRGRRGRSGHERPDASAARLRSSTEMPRGV